MNDGGFDAGFLDVAANALAIMIFVTMFALLTVRSEPTVLHDARFDRERPLTLRVQPPLAERPFLDYYLVFDGMIVRWEQERYVEHLIEHGLRDTVQAEGGKLRVSARMEPRDPNSYTASFAPDFDALAGRATVLTAEAVDAVAAKIRDREKTHRRVPNFVVYPSGMEAFESLYTELREAPIWMRWFLWPDDAPLKIERRVANFTRFELDF